MKSNIILSIVFIVLLGISIFIRFPKYVYNKEYGTELVSEFSSYNYLPVVQGELNGHKAYFILDSGASVSVLHSAYANEFDFIVGNPDGGEVHGYGGTTSSMQEVHNAKITVGKVNMKAQFKAQDLSAITSSVRSATGKRIVGIIGNNNISKNSLILDFRKNAIYK